jgi:hypothetical protein
MKGLFHHIGMKAKKKGWVAKKKGWVAKKKGWVAIRNKDG